MVPTRTTVLSLAASLPQAAKIPTEATAIATKPNNRLIFIIFPLSDEPIPLV